MPSIFVTSINARIPHVLTYILLLLGETTKTLSVTLMSTPLFVICPLFVTLSSYFITSYNITHCIELQINPPLEMKKVHGIDCKSFSSLVFNNIYIGLVCPGYLNHNVPMLKFLRMLLMIFGVVGQIAYH